jgi:hypothetical protein
MQHSTPYIPSGAANKSSKAPRPPIHNPYDKFTQPEFEAWIGDITSTLRKALGQEPVPLANGGSNATGDHLDYTSEEEADTSEDDSEESQSIQDSFAEVKARRAKGKGRDPREGPGLGSQHQPIDVELDSDSEEYSDDESRYDHGSYIEEKMNDIFDSISPSPFPERPEGPETTQDEPIDLTSDEECIFDDESTDAANEARSPNSPENELVHVSEREDQLEGDVARDDHLDVDGVYRGVSPQTGYLQPETSFDRCGNFSEILMDEDVDGQQLRFPWTFYTQFKSVVLIRFCCSQ